ncbi:conserved hypothetical protein [Ricinus communis]|uniref:Uncharacterized protein n=1 Tax=Ricinus communis TaxID=3988 RepID=B9SM98_RICCO|nr:conserved hypothetical protein [Ricinus communis]
MDKKEDKDKENLGDPKPEPSATNQNLSQDVETLQRQGVLLDASTEALIKRYHEKLDDMEKKHKIYVEAFKDFCEKNEMLEMLEMIKGDKSFDAGIAIASGSEEEEVNDEKFVQLSALFDLTVYGNINRAHRNISRFKSAESKEIHGLEPKIHALVTEGDRDYTDYNADQGEIKKISFLDCLKDFDESDAAVGYETLKSLKTRAINHGKDLSRLVINLMFLESDTEGLRAKFQILGDLLKWASQGERTVVIRRFLDLLHTADAIMSHWKNNKSLEQKAVLVLEEEEAAGSEGSIDRELGEETDVFFGLMKEIFRLELFWVHPGLPDSIKTKLKDYAFPLLVADMKRCEEALKWLELDVKLSKPCTFKFREDHQTFMETDDYKAMESKINELWNGIQESEKEKEQKLE